MIQITEIAGISPVWIIFITFCFLGIALVFAEAAWISRRGWARFGIGVGFSAVTNLIGGALGALVIFIISVVFVVSFAATWDGLHKQDFPLADYQAISLLIIGAIFPIIILILCKRIFLPLLKIQRGKAAWVFAALSSILSLLILFGVPVLMGYLFYR